VLEELHSRYQETVNLALLDGRHVIYVERLESPRSLRTATAIGTLTPLHCAALGKAILAHLPQEEQDRFLSSGPLETLTDRTITDPDRLAQELVAIRRRGYALDEGENIDGVYCAGAPIFDAQGHVAAAVSVSGPVQRMSELIADRTVAESVLQAASQVSQRLGYVLPEVENALIREQ
jgi:DNA-binding IclR family transcriptional regulator